MTQGGRAGGPGGVLTGQNFQEWSDRMRDVEEMLGDPKLQSEVAAIRDRARSMRAEFKRHSKKPAWDLIQKQLVAPMAELEKRLAEEIARRDTDKSLVPIDRDPVPSRYSELVRLYYERLGSGK